MKTEKPAPQDHLCTKPGCTAFGSFGFLFPGGRQEWGCGPHRAEMDAEWTEATQLRADELAAQAKPPQGSLW